MVSQTRNVESYLWSFLVGGAPAAIIGMGASDDPQFILGGLLIFAMAGAINTLVSAVLPGLKDDIRQVVILGLILLPSLYLSMLPAGVTSDPQVIDNMVTLTTISLIAGVPVVRILIYFADLATSKLAGE